MIFESREHAAHLLAARLRAWKGRRPLVLAIPRGAVPMASVLAAELEGELDVALVHKLRAPAQPELAVGAVDEAGHAEIEPYAHQFGATALYLDAERELQVSALRERRATYTPGRGPVDPAGRIVIVVDDGIATGATMAAALRAVRARGPERLIAAAGVASAQAVARLERIADEVVCLEMPPDMDAVSLWFGVFPQIEDEQVVAMLAGDRAKPGA